MNKLKFISAITLALIFMNATNAATVVFEPKPSSGGSGGIVSGGSSSSDNGAVVNYAVVDQEVTAIKNTKTSITSTVATDDNGEDPGIYKLTSSPVGIYGILDFSSDGSYTYLLNNESDVVRSLGENELAKDTFSFSKTGNSQVSTAVLTVNVISTTPGSEIAELQATLIKSESNSVNGSLINTFGFNGEDKTAAFIRMTSSKLGDYGQLELKAIEDPTKFFDFVYQINHELPQVQALSIDDSVQDEFFYEIVDTNGSVLEVKLIINITSNSAVSKDNVEIEFNNRSNEPTPLNSGQFIRGQMTSSSDRDFYVISSLGNEIISLELCPVGSLCFDEKAWVLYVFDADKVAAKDGFDDLTGKLQLRAKDFSQVFQEWDVRHMYFLYNQGFYDDTLIGVIDPCYGDATSLDVGTSSTPKNYLIVISTPLARDGGEETCSSGNIVHKEDLTIGDIEAVREFLVIYPYSDDQYSIKVTRTGINPLAQASAESPIFNEEKQVVEIPKVRIYDKVYSAKLKQLITPKNSASLANFGVEELELVEEKDASNLTSVVPVFNPANDTLKLQQIIVDKKAYEAELHFNSRKGVLELKKATPISKIK